MIDFEFPNNCQSEASRWVYTEELCGELIRYHNEICSGLSPQEAEAWRAVVFRPMNKIVHYKRNIQIDIAKQGAFWNPKIPDHVNNGEIFYPSSLNQNNEGSRGVFLFGLIKELSNAGEDIRDENMKAVMNEIGQARKDLLIKKYWNPSLEVFVNVS